MGDNEKPDAPTFEKLSDDSRTAENDVEAEMLLTEDDALDLA